MDSRSPVANLPHPIVPMEPDKLRTNLFLVFWFGVSLFWGTHTHTRLHKKHVHVSNRAVAAMKQWEGSSANGSHVSLDSAVGPVISSSNVAMEQ